jgi:hypothetical protein
VFNPFAKKSAPPKVEAAKPAQPPAPATMGLSFGEPKNTSADFSSNVKPVNLNNTGSILSGGPKKKEEDIAEQISDNYEEDFEEESIGKSGQKEDEFFKPEKKKIEK